LASAGAGQSPSANRALAIRRLRVLAIRRLRVLAIRRLLDTWEA